MLVQYKHIKPEQNNLSPKFLQTDKNSVPNKFCHLDDGRK